MVEMIAPREIARSFPGVGVVEFPVNLGHGVALQVTYRYCVDHGVYYVVTLDADGQNDPSEIPQILEPLLADTADFVLGSRVLGEDKTTDKVRKLGVRFFSFIMNRMTGANITDTSTGYRALRVTMWPTSSTDCARSSTRPRSCSSPA